MITAFLRKYYGPAFLPFVFLIFSLSPFLSLSAWGLEVYSLLTKDCHLNKGLILGVTQEQVEMLTLEGEYRQIQRDDLRYLAVYNTIDNPIEKLKNNPRLDEMLLKIYVDDQREPSFVGWPVKFVEDLVIFFDINGKSHVFELYKIRRIRPYGKKSLKSLQLSFQPVVLSYESWVSQCSLPDIKEKAKVKKEIVRPTRMLGDQIQISEFLTQYQDGFENVKSFQERTYVYARPFLYERSTKLGFLVFGKKNFALSPVTTMPMYFQWTKGREFRFQSFNQIGSVPVEYLPTVEPLTVFRSDMKSHIFHATFVGNLDALSAGTEYFTPAVESATKDDSGRLPYNPYKPNFKSHSAASINYMALMGGDWGPWSLSVGTYFPNFMIQTSSEFREILASKLAPLFRLMYTGSNYRLHGMFGFTELEQEHEVQDSQISRSGELSVFGYIDQFYFKSHYIRAGVAYSLNKDVEVTLDQLWLQANYEETLATLEKNQFDFSHLVTQASVRHFFGEYVSLRAYLQFFKVEDSYRFGGISSTNNSTNSTYGGAFEFIF